MARKRMFSKEIVTTKNFLELPPSSRALYYQLGMEADDDGFIDPYIVMLSTKASDVDLKLLIVKNFLISFSSGVFVITNWNQNNTLKSDRYRKTIYLKELESLKVLENGAYSTLEPERNHSGTILEPQYSIGKYSIVKDSIGKEKRNTLVSINSEDTFKEIAEAYKVPISFVQSKYEDLVNYCESTGKTYKDYLAALRNWVKKDAEKIKLDSYKEKHGESRLAVFKAADRE